MAAAIARILKTDTLQKDQINEHIIFYFLFLTEREDFIHMRDEKIMDVHILGNNLRGLFEHNYV